MTTTKNTKTTAPLAHRVPATVSPLIAEYSRWLQEQTGVEIDAMSVYLGSQLRSLHQKTPENQARLAQAAKDRAAQDAAKAARKIEREAAAVKKAAEPKVEKVAPAKKAPAKAVPATKAPARRRPTKAAPVAPVAPTTEAAQA